MEIIPAPAPDHDPNATCVAGVDIGHSWIRCAIADLTGAVITRHSVRNAARSASTVVTTVSRLARDSAAGAGLPWSRVVQTVVGSPGVFNPADGTLLLASRIRRWGRPSLLDALRSELGETTAIANDANLAALGERTFGRGTSAQSFVYLLVGTGVGMGIVIDGKLHVGHRGAAGEVAYLPFGEEAGLRPPAFGSRWGWFEETVSAQSVVRTAVELGMSSRLSALQVFDAARRGNPAARTAVDREAERLALIIAAVAAVLDPELVVLGGGVGGELEILREPMEQRIHQLTPFRPQLVVSALGEDAVILGAIDAALELVRGQALAGPVPSTLKGSLTAASGVGSSRHARMTSSRPSSPKAPAAAPSTPAALPRTAGTSSGGGERVSRRASSGRS